MSNLPKTYAEFFATAFPGKEAFDYQLRLAEIATIPALVAASTGAGKTAATVGMWIWRILTAPETVGRRLVYCLPMRSLVEQTVHEIRKALANLVEAGIIEAGEFEVHALLGGDAKLDWDTTPEAKAIIVGTQDMLLSRALNRGYAMSRFRWPQHFGLLNNDCFWVFDEVQLMADGLATSAQLAAFRERFGTIGPVHSLWMSATIDRDWLRTIDFAASVDDLPLIELSAEDRASPILGKRLRATKRLASAPASCALPAGLADFVRQGHTAGTQTLVIVNRVARARETFEALERAFRDDANAPDLRLLHSRFRPAERAEWKALFSSKPDPDGPGRIIVATQVAEAGLDISSRLLVTDLAPFASMVQRFGRCNREGEYDEAHIFWVERPLTAKDAKLAQKPALDAKDAERVAQPYEPESVALAKEIVASLSSASPDDLRESLFRSEPYVPENVLRARDMVALFDTSADLSGYDLDVSRFVRGGDERDVSVVWRDLGGQPPPPKIDRPRFDELCAVPIGEFQEFIAGKGPGGDPRTAWVWDVLEGIWRKALRDEIRPGLTLMLDASAGGYSPSRGWEPSSNARVEPVPPPQKEAPANPEEAHGDDPESFPKYAGKYRQTLAAHSREVKAALENILGAFGLAEINEWKEDLVCAAHTHDWGKTHDIFQETLHKGLEKNDPLHSLLLAKSDKDHKHSRPSFRHELASALALVKAGANDLVVYLVAAHHGKIRLSIRALPGEERPKDEKRKFARGVWDGNTLPEVNLGDGRTEPSVVLDLEPMLLGAQGEDGSSWITRMTALRDRIGIFRLAYLESIVRAADVRASRQPKETI